MSREREAFESWWPGIPGANQRSDAFRAGWLAALNTLRQRVDQLQNPDCGEPEYAKVLAEIEELAR